MAMVSWVLITLLSIQVPNKLVLLQPGDNLELVNGPVFNIQWDLLLMANCGGGDTMVILNWVLVILLTI